MYALRNNKYDILVVKRGYGYYDLNSFKTYKHSEVKEVNPTGIRITGILPLVEKLGIGELIRAYNENSIVIKGIGNKTLTIKGKKIPFNRLYWSRVRDHDIILKYDSCRKRIGGYYMFPVDKFYEMLIDAKIMGVVKPNLWVKRKSRNTVKVVIKDICPILLARYKQMKMYCSKIFSLVHDMSLNDDNGRELQGYIERFNIHNAVQIHSDILKDEAKIKNLFLKLKKDTKLFIDSYTF